MHNNQVGGFYYAVKSYFIVIAIWYLVTVLNTPGTIDEDYRDEIKIILINTDKENSKRIDNGDRIAQGVLCAVAKADICEIEEFSKEAKDNDRRGGFGSTGQ